MEPHVLHTATPTGWIEVVCGSMFSGKTEELIRRLRRARIAQQQVASFKPALDDRFSDTEVVSHDDNTIPSTAVDTADQILLLEGGADVIGIDEAQFFGPDLVQVCQQLARSGQRVIVAGLDQDYRGHPFEPIPQLMAVAEYVTKLHAICMQCGAPANHSQRLSASDERVLVGAEEAYEPRCRGCFSPEEGMPPDASEHSSSATERSAAPKADPSPDTASTDTASATAPPTDATPADEAA
jgi:thymidine kinase